MMTPKRFQRITGHDALIEHADGSYLASCHCACSGGDTTICGEGETEAGALAQLLHEVYRAHSAIVLARDGWKCRNCGRVAGLSVHHRVPRSKGRDDRPSNLIALCLACHDTQHSH